MRLRYLLALLPWLMTCPAQALQEGQGEIKEIQGGVFVGQGDSHETPAKLGQIIQAGVSLRTDSDSYSVLLLSDGSLLRLGPQTLFTIEEAVPLRWGWVRWTLNLLQGNARVLVPKNPYKEDMRLKVKTPSAAMGIRGTEFYVEYYPQTGTRLFTYSGTVAIAKNMGELLLDKTTREVRSKQFVEVVSAKSRSITVRQQEGNQIPQGFSAVPADNFYKELPPALKNIPPQMNEGEKREYEKLEETQKREFFLQAESRMKSLPRTKEKVGSEAPKAWTRELGPQTEISKIPSIASKRAPEEKRQRPDSIEKKTMIPMPKKVATDSTVDVSTLSATWTSKSEEISEKEIQPTPKDSGSSPKREKVKKAEPDVSTSTKTSTEDYLDNFDTTLVGKPSKTSTDTDVEMKERTQCPPKVLYVGTCRKEYPCTSCPLGECVSHSATPQMSGSCNMSQTATSTATAIGVK